MKKKRITGEPLIQWPKKIDHYNANNYILKDAENFAELFSGNSKLTSENIQKNI